MNSRHTTVRQAMWRAPGRVNLIGDHTDYNDGFALPFAISRGVTASTTVIAEPLLRISSTARQPFIQVPLTRLEPGTVTGWAAYPAGVVWAIGVQTGRGVAIALDGDVPIGAGLSSSAAVTCATASALNDLWQLGLTSADIVTLARRAENEFVGVPTGAMDQMAAVHCRAGNALLFDARAMTIEHIPFSPKDDHLALLVTDTRQAHDHLRGAYANRRSACLKAARQLGVTALRDIPLSDLPSAQEELADPLLAAATRHVVTENARVLEIADLLRAGYLRAVGPILSASHNSLRDNLAASTRAVDLAVSAACNAGAIGARMTGGGFGGCTITLAERDRLPAIIATITAAFASRNLLVPDLWVESPRPGAEPIPAEHTEAHQQ
jgi:galactokinase